MRRGHRFEDVETFHRTKDGRRIAIALTISPIWNDAGEIIGTSAIVRDITARKAAEAEQAETYQHTCLVLERIGDGFHDLARGFASPIKRLFTTES